MVKHPVDYIKQGRSCPGWCHLLGNQSEVFARPLGANKQLLIFPAPIYHWRQSSYVLWQLCEGLKGCKDTLRCLNLITRCRFKNYMDVGRSGLNPRPSSRSHGNYEVWASKGWNSTQMGDLLCTWFPVHPTYGPPNQSERTQVYVYFQSTMWNLGTCPWRSKANILHGFSNSHNSYNAYFRITYRLRPTWK